MRCVQGPRGIVCVAAAGLGRSYRHAEAPCSQREGNREMETEQSEGRTEIETGVTRVSVKIRIG